MPCPHPAFPSPVVALEATGVPCPAQVPRPPSSSWLPWTPAVLWDWVILTCQGSGNASDTSWYKDVWRWCQDGYDHFLVTESDTYTCVRSLSMLSPPVMASNAPLLYRFYLDRQLVGGPQGSPHLLMPAVGVSHSGNYSCDLHSDGGEGMRKSSARLGITVRSGFTFTWLRNGQEVARGPLLELGAVDVGHLGTYQCMATNQLGQDGHHVFRVLSPELVLEMTSCSPWLT
ncbi:hypothetical protein Nmel_011459, partial [Mimus melanotis]